MFSALAGQGQIYVHLTDGIWSQIKSAGYGRGLWLGLGRPGVETAEQWAQVLLAPDFLLHSVAPSSALYASRLYLGQYQLTHPERLAKHYLGGPRIRGTHPAPIPHLCPRPQPPQPSEPWLLTSHAGVKSQSLPSLNEIWFGVFVPRSSLLLLGNVYVHPTAKVAPSAVVSGRPAQGHSEGGCQDWGAVWVLWSAGLCFVTACHAASCSSLPCICSMRGLGLGPSRPSRTYGMCSAPQLGPNVSIGEGVTVGEGVRLRESIVLHGATLQVSTWASTWAHAAGSGAP